MTGFRGNGFTAFRGNGFSAFRGRGFTISLGVDFRELGLRFAFFAFV